ncbi:MAG: helix-turn-helix transcriptional regulator [Eggerthellaceae bacterium]|nr:helix-turn-helix transcriptional regulator [Eggerthellaceae bacterium]
MAYSVALVAVVFALLMAHARLGSLLGRQRWVVAALGAAGALGLVLRMPNGPLADAGTAGLCVGAVLSAAYVPVHFAYWMLYARRSENNETARTVAWSFGLFAVAYGALSLVGANSVYVSIACPLVSAAMALACPHTGAEPLDEGEIATEAATPGLEPDPEPKPTAAPPAGPGPALPDGFAEAFALSEREAELAAYAHRNLSARRIAGELFIAESTVYTHLKRIYRKTGVHSKGELIELIETWPQS